MDSKKLQYASVKDISIIHFLINLFIDIETGYSFYRYYYLKGKVALSLLLPTNIICFDISCSITLYDITFFLKSSILYTNLEDGYLYYSPKFRS